MKTKLLLFAISLLLTSCATLFSKKDYEMRVTSNAKNSSVVVNSKTYNLPAIVVVKRSKENLPIIFKTDSIEKKLNLKSRIRPYFLIGNLFFYAPISYVIDLSSDKRFYYKNNIHIKVKDTAVSFSSISFPKKISSIFTSSLKDEKGVVKIHYSLPYINSFNFKPTGESRANKTGFFGFAGGLDYFYTKNTFVAFQADAKTTFEFPIPVLISREDGEYATFSSVNFSLSNNKKLNKFSYGYGVNYAVNIWINKEEYYDSFTNQYVKNSKRRVNENLGLHLNSYFYIANNFSIGVVYQPSFLNFKSGPNLFYEHSVSLDLAWKIKLFSIKK